MHNMEGRTYRIFRVALGLTVMSTRVTAKASTVEAHGYYVAIQNSQAQTHL